MKTYNTQHTHNMNTLEITTISAYNSGFRAGFNTGEENNPFEDGELYRAYRDGYSSGVTEYCHAAHPKD